ncbi:hypothetical protein OPV22_016525 [Ensete ventricosum]|uniref:Ribosomal protein L7/L12 oligomerisation domain-containing protein n=1 Tax=Ensete ventricosum TaxID=4639 RepID=A0AAV8QRR6_ENSVE|nr:hypothetical protein OPV22_016525 [Ensete ventricosum]
MKLVAAYLLGGNSQSSAGDLRSILESLGAEAEEERIDLLLFEVKGKEIAELIAAGRKKFASVPSGGAAPLASSVGGAAASAPAAAEPKKEEKEESDEFISYRKLGIFLCPLDGLMDNDNKSNR